MFLWELLKQRPIDASLKHQKMPSWKEHCAFVRSKPYLHWYLIKVPRYASWSDEALEVHTIGAVLLNRALGVDIIPSYRRNGYATKALREVMRLHPRDEYIANINPGNIASIALFEKLGFHRTTDTQWLKDCREPSMNIGHKHIFMSNS